jgi:hypothetical protein
VSEFLSAAWLAELDAAGRAAGPVAEMARFSLTHIVSGVPGRGEVQYVLRFEPEGITVGGTGTGTGDVMFVTDYETAVALAQGTVNAQQALAQGRLRVRGDIAVLTYNASAVTRYGDVFASVRASTSYPSVDSNA